MNSPIKSTKGYNGNPNLPKENTKIEWTQELLDEFIKCKNDPAHFAKNYIKIVSLDDGLQTIKLYDYQEEILNAYPDNLKLCLCQSRQSGKTTIVVAIILHYVIFNKSARAAMLAQKLDQAIEIMDRLQIAYEYLPAFLKPGVKQWNVKSIEFDNGSILLAAASSSSNIRGKSFGLLYLDEHGHIPRYQEFAASVLPVLSSGKNSRLIISSTPNGLNQFYDVVSNARKNLNGFWLKEVPWFAVPGRDEAWKQGVLADLNYDMVQFAQEYELEFAGSSGTLISGSHLKRMESVKPISTHDGLCIYESPKADRLYTMNCDVSHGKGLDYSAFHVIDVTALPFRQVATYRNNEITPADYATTINSIGKHYNNAQVLVENNDIGSQVTYILWNEYEYENLLSSQSNGRLGKKLVSGVGSKSDFGIRMSASVKSLGCSILKLLVEANNLVIIDASTIAEVQRFSKKKDSNLSYQAEEGCHDDLVMGLVNFAWMTTTELFKDYTNGNAIMGSSDVNDAEFAKMLLNVGIMNDGISEPQKYVKFEGDGDWWETTQYPLSTNYT